MCGIAGLYLFPSAETKGYRVDETVAALLAAIDHRGGDACGVAHLRPDGIVVCQDAPVRAGRFESLRRTVPDDAVAVLCHTRLATQGSEYLSGNNHPVTYGACTVTHNGVIANDWEVFDTLHMERFAEVDTEAIPAALDAHEPDDWQSALGLLEGSMAFAALDDRAPGRLLLGRGSWSPLHVYCSRHAIVWASTASAVSAGWRALTGGKVPFKKVAAMGDGDALIVTPEGFTHERFEMVERPLPTKHQYRVQLDPETRAWLVASGYSQYEGGGYGSAFNEPDALPDTADDLVSVADLEACDLCGVEFDYKTNTLVPCSTEPDSSWPIDWLCPTCIGATSARTSSDWVRDPETGFWTYVYNDGERGESCAVPGSLYSD